MIQTGIVLIDPPRYGGDAVDVLQQLGFVFPKSAGLSADGGVLAANPDDHSYIAFERDGQSYGDAKEVVRWIEQKGLPANLAALSMLTMRVLSDKVGLVVATQLWSAQEGHYRYAHLRHLLETPDVDPGRDLRPWELWAITRVNGSDERSPQTPVRVARNLCNSHHSVYRSGSGVPLQSDDIVEWMLRHPDVGDLFKGVLTSVDPKNGTRVPRDRGGRRPPRHPSHVR